MDGASTAAEGRKCFSERYRPSRRHTVSQTYNVAPPAAAVSSARGVEQLPGQARGGGLALKCAATAASDVQECERVASSMAEVERDFTSAILNVVETFGKGDFHFSALRGGA